MPIQQMLLGGGAVPEADPDQVLLTGDHQTGTSWTVPDGVTSISVVCIGAGAPSSFNSGGGAGGALAYANNITVTPGATLTYIIDAQLNDLKTELQGPASGSQQAWTLTAYGGNANYSGGTRAATGNPGSVTSNTPPGGNGGSSAVYASGTMWMYYQGGGGAGGYAGNGGNAGYGGGTCSGWGCLPPQYDPTAGSGGGGGGGGMGRGMTTSFYYRAGGGGGTGPYGQSTTNGSAGTNQHSSDTGNGTAGGGYGSYTAQNSSGGTYGGGAGISGLETPTQGAGCVRIMWPGGDRQFPSTRTADE